jgi:hypothetical protein
MAVAACRVVVSDCLAYTGRVIAHDRAAVVTTAIVQIFRTAPPQEWQQAIESYLRDELASVEPAPDFTDFDNDPQERSTAMNRATDVPVELKLIHATLLAQWPCSVCGDVIGRDSRLAAVGKLPCGCRLTVCESCLEKGQGRIDERLAQHAHALEHHAEWLRVLIGRLRLPDFEQCQTERARAEATMRQFDEDIDDSLPF